LLVDLTALTELDRAISDAGEVGICAGQLTIGARADPMWLCCFADDVKRSGSPTR
jgi:hypothetical protein